MTDKGCSICGKPVRSKGLCTTHYWRQYRHGDPNQVRLVRTSKAYMEDGIGCLDMYGADGTVDVTCVVDTEDIARINKQTWVYSPAVKRIVNATGDILLSRWLLNIPKNTHTNKSIHFLNEDKLDFRKCNLQLILGFLSRNYTPKHKKYRGVYLLPSGKYHARIFLRGKSHSLGSYSEEDEAAKAYNTKALELFGDMAVLNKIVK